MDGGEGLPNFLVFDSVEAKLEELLHRITSLENSSPLAMLEFIMILKGVRGGELLHEFVRASPKCSELLDAWKLWQGKQEFSVIVQLIADVFSHPEGKCKSTIRKRLDKFARSLVAEYLGDVYMELNSEQVLRQRNALLLMASIVRRGPKLASDFSERFDFNHAGFTDLASREWIGTGTGDSLRKSYVGFAMSFLEVGEPDLLGRVLQKKKMYSAVLKWLSCDDSETVVYILSTLRDRVLVQEALVPPALRSTLFRTKALEELIYISEIGGPTAEVAYNLLVLVCTDPSNGLMPDLKKGPVPLEGNGKRMMRIMIKLNPAHVQYHRDLLFAIVNGRPSFGLSYLKKFPYNIEDFRSHSWLAAVFLATSLLPLIGNGLSREFFNSQPHDLHIPGNMDVKRVMKCMFPRPFSGSLITKGLLHTCILARHATLRLLFELLKLLDFIISNCRSSSTNQPTQHVVSIYQGIQHDVQALLREPNVLLPLRCSTHGSCLKGSGSPLKYRSRWNKMSEMDAAERGADLYEEDNIGMVGEIWGLETMITSLKEVEVHLHSKLHEVLNYFQCL